MNRELRRAIHRKCREILEEELDIEKFIYLADRKGYDLPNGKHVGGIPASDPQWAEIDNYIKKLHGKAFRGGT